MALSVNVRSIDVSKGFVVFVLCFSPSVNEMAVQSGHDAYCATTIAYFHLIRVGV